MFSHYADDARPHYANGASPGNSPQAPPEKVHRLGAIKGTIEFGNISGGRIIIGTLNGRLHVNRMLAAERMTLHGSAKAPSSDPRAIYEQAEQSGTLGSDRLKMGDVSEGIFQIDSIDGVMIVTGEVTSPANITVQGGNTAVIDVRTLMAAEHYIRKPGGRESSNPIVRHIANGTVLNAHAGNVNIETMYAASEINDHLDGD